MIPDLHILLLLLRRKYILFLVVHLLLGFWPYETPHTILENNDINCRPCSKSGRDICPQGHFKCLKEIHFDFEIPEFISK